MSIKDQIRAEIERRMFEDYNSPNIEQNETAQGVCAGLLAFLDTLPEQPVEKTSYDTQKYTPSSSVSIEDVARVQFSSHAKLFDKKRKAVFDWEQFKEVASIFYGFGKKDSPETKEKEPAEGLEEEIKRMVYDVVYDLDGPAIMGTSEYLSVEDIANIARHFAEWGADHLRSVTKMVHDGLEEAATEFANQDCVTFISRKKGFIAGAEWMKAKMLKDDPVILPVEDFQALIDSHAKRVEADYKEKMMKDAVEIEVKEDAGGYPIVPLDAIELYDYENDKPLAKAGNKVKVIVIKED